MLPPRLFSAFNNARAIKPNQYIWRRRIEQYGPQLTKPYPFYDWVETAARDVRARGDQPVELRILPTGSEIASPGSSFDAEERNVKPPDPQGRILRDVQSLILTEVTIVPPQVKPEGTVRIHVTLRPNNKRKALWISPLNLLWMSIDRLRAFPCRPMLQITSSRSSGVTLMRGRLSS